MEAWPWLKTAQSKTTSWSKAPEPSEDQLRWLDLKHMWGPRRTPPPRAGSLIGKHSCNIEHRGRRRPLMFAPLCCGLGCFLPAVPPLWHHSGPRAGGHQRRRRGVCVFINGKYSYPYAPSPPEKGKRLPLKGGDLLAAHEKLQNIK